MIIWMRKLKNIDRYKNYIIDGHKIDLISIYIFNFEYGHNVKVLLYSATYFFEMTFSSKSNI